MKEEDKGKKEERKWTMFEWKNIEKEEYKWKFDRWTSNLYVVEEWIEPSNCKWKIEIT